MNKASDAGRIAFGSAAVGFLVVLAWTTKNPDAHSFFACAAVVCALLSIAAGVGEHRGEK